MGFGSDAPRRFEPFEVGLVLGPSLGCGREQLVGLVQDEDVWAALPPCEMADGQVGGVDPVVDVLAGCLV
jgi:hypothetical protein